MSQFLIRIEQILNWQIMSEKQKMKMTIAVENLGHM